MSVATITGYCIYLHYGQSYLTERSYLYMVPRRIDMEDKKIKCIDCHKDFIFTAGVREKLIKEPVALDSIEYILKYIGPRILFLHPRIN